MFFWYILSHAVASPGFAQQPGDIEAIQQQTDRLIQQQQQQLDAERDQRDRARKRTLLQPASPPVPTVEDSEREALCFQIDRIEISGSRFSEEMRSIARKFENQCLSVGAIDQVIRTITLWYLDRGYVTSRAYLPQQDLGTKTLRIEVVEGKLESFDRSRAQDIAIATAFPDTIDRHLNLRDIEQGIEQLNRLASNNVTIDLVPGELNGSIFGEPQAALVRASFFSPLFLLRASMPSAVTSTILIFAFRVSRWLI